MPIQATSAPRQITIPRRAESRFYTGMALAAICTAIVGFVPALVDHTSREAPLTFAVAVHGLITASWLVLFLVQSLLVGKGRIAVHRRLGYVGALLAVCLVVSGFATTIAMGRRGFDLSGDLHIANDPSFTMIFQLSDLIVFSLLVAAGIAYRRRPAVHKRLMLLATVGTLMPAALTHIIGHFQFLHEIKAPVVLIPLAMFLFAGAVHDRMSRGRIHPVSLWVALAMFIWSNFLGSVIGPSEHWHQFVAWLIA